MSHDTAVTGRATGDRTVLRPTRRSSTETKAAYKTTELIAYVLGVFGALIASAVTDVSDFGMRDAWFYVTALTFGYMVSRGLAKAGSLDRFDGDPQGWR